MWPAMVTGATLLRTAGEEERESRASSSGVSPSSAMALAAGSEAEKRGRGRMERAGGKLGLGLSKMTSKGVVAHRQRARETMRRSAPAHGQHEGHAAQIQKF